ncbi:MAG: helix-turn-helix domain-containing protein [Alphaproteobacteria bacterium]|nr:helix-turn-helix domain-containing protein [Alphaproteobacteria bacterium]
MENKKKPNPIDVHVGGRVKIRRTMIGMSQEKLGESLGLTFQQIQKYEKGTNRMGASRLFQIAQVLDVPLQFLFEGLEPQAGRRGFSEDGPSFEPSEPFMRFMSSPEGVELCRHFADIADPRVRKRIIDLIKTLSGPPPRNDG